MAAPLDIRRRRLLPKKKSGPVRPVNIPTPPEPEPDDEDFDDEAGDFGAGDSGSGGGTASLDQRFGGQGGGEDGQKDQDSKKDGDKKKDKGDTNKKGGKEEDGKKKEPKKAKSSDDDKGKKSGKDGKGKDKSSEDGKDKDKKKRKEERKKQKRNKADQKKQQKKQAKDAKKQAKKAKNAKKQALKRVAKYFGDSELIEDIVVIVAGVFLVGWLWILFDGFEKRNIYRVGAILVIWALAGAAAIVILISPAIIAWGVVKELWDGIKGIFS